MDHGEIPVIVRTNFCDEPAVMGTNGVLSMTVVPNWGGSLISLYHVGKQIELLRVPSSQSEYCHDSCVFGMPVLFPPNRIADGKFTFNGRQYQFQITEPSLNNHEHGLVFKEAWRVTDEAVTDKSVSISTTIASAEHPTILDQFPHSFTLRSTYTLRGHRLDIETELSNSGDDPFPWGLGYHTTFRLPMNGGDAAACCFKSDVHSQWVLNSRFLPTGDMSRGRLTANIRTGMAVNACPLDDIFSADDGPKMVTVTDAHAGVEITYRCGDKFKFWVFYNDDGNQGYLATEPYTWVTNAPNLSLPCDVTGLAVLQPGERVALSSSITVCDL